MELKKDASRSATPCMKTLDGLHRIVRLLGECGPQQASQTSGNPLG